MLLTDQSCREEEEDFRKFGKREEPATEVLYAFLRLNSSLFSSNLRLTLQFEVSSMQLFCRLFLCSQLLLVPAEAKKNPFAKILFLWGSFLLKYVCFKGSHLTVLRVQVRNALNFFIK